MSLLAAALALALGGAAMAQDRVTPQMFGARGDGATDDTAAFVAALAAGPVAVPPGVYLVGDIAVPDGGVLEGSAGSAASGDTGYSRAAQTSLVARLGARSILDVAGRRGAVIGGLLLDGAGTGADCVSGGSTDLALTHVTALRCDHGLGSGGADPASAGSHTTGATIVASRFADSRIGVANLAKSTMIGGAVTANDVGIWQERGANGSTFIGVQAEGCRRHNIRLAGAADLQFVGGVAASGGAAGAYLTGATRVQFTGTTFRANGVEGDDDPLGESHLVLDGGNTGIVLVGTVFAAGPGSPAVPRFGITFTGENGLVVIAGGDGTGVGQGFSRGPRPARLRLRDVEGAE